MFNTGSVASGFSTETVEPVHEIVRDTVRTQEPVVQPNDNGAADFTTNPRTNMWDSIHSSEEEDDLDVPPTLRDRLRNKNRE